MIDNEYVNDKVNDKVVPIWYDSVYMFDCVNVFDSVNVFDCVNVSVGIREQSTSVVIRITLKVPNVSLWYDVNVITVDETL